MSPNNIVDILRDVFITATSVAVMPLILSLLVGLIVAIFQAATQVNEQTLSFVPKLFVIGLSVVLFSGWMMRLMTEFVGRLFTQLQTFM